MLETIAEVLLDDATRQHRLKPLELLRLQEPSVAWFNLDASDATWTKKLDGRL